MNAPLLNSLFLSIDLARLNAIQRAPEAIPDVVKQYSFAKEDHILGKVVRHRIVVATCSTSGE